MRRLSTIVYFRKQYCPQKVRVILYVGRKKFMSSSSKFFSWRRIYHWEISFLRVYSSGGHSKNIHTGNRLHCTKDLLKDKTLSLVFFSRKSFSSESFRVRLIFAYFFLSFNCVLKFWCGLYSIKYGIIPKFNYCNQLFSSFNFWAVFCGKSDF